MSGLHVESDGGPFRHLLRRSLAALGIAALLVAVCYFFVDRTVAYWVHERAFSDWPVLKWLTYPPPILQAWAPAVLAGLMVRRAWGPFSRGELVLLAAFVAVIVADQFRQSLAFLFGRYWPETWVDNNPSLIGSGAYGFHPFHSGQAYRSFPSGHAARTAALAAPVWIGYPRWRWACVAAFAAVAVGLIGMDYHFVGDVMAGGFVGSIVGAYVTAGIGARESGIEN